MSFILRIASSSSRSAASRPAGAAVAFAAARYSSGAASSVAPESLSASPTPESILRQEERALSQAQPYLADSEEPSSPLMHPNSPYSINDLLNPHDLTAFNAKRTPPVTPSTFDSLGSEIVMLKNNKGFFHLQSPLLMDYLKLVETAGQMREAMELVKLWRYSGGVMDWPLAQIICDAALRSQTPFTALFVLMHPVAFGIHLFSPLRPPIVVPTSLYPSTPKKDFFMLSSILATADRAYELRNLPNLPRQHKYIVLPKEKIAVEDPDSPADALKHIDGVTEPEFLREFLRVLFVGGEEEGRSREVTEEEVSWLSKEIDKVYPEDPVVGSYFLLRAARTEAEGGLEEWEKAYGAYKGHPSAAKEVTLSEQQRAAVEEARGLVSSWEETRGGLKGKEEEERTAMFEEWRSKQGENEKAEGEDATSLPEEESK